jgi:hypothetical protein
MLHFIKRQVARFKQKKYGVTEYGTTIHAYPIEGFGEVKFAQWMHPSEKQVILSKSHVDFYKQLAREGGTIVDIGTHRKPSQNQMQDQHHRRDAPIIPLQPFVSVGHHT